MDVDDEDVFGGQGQRNPTLPYVSQNLQLPLSLQPPTPLQPQIPSRWNPAWIVGRCQYSNVWRPSNIGQSDNKYHPTGHHYQPHINFVENG
jgi:hypothetical protein